MDHVRQTIETWCVMVSIIDLVMIDERSGILTVISPAQERLAETGSDKLPSLPWDPGVHLVSRIFHYKLHLGLVWSGPTGICLIERGNFSLLIIMIGHGNGWTSTSSIEVSLQIQFLESRSDGHSYFILRTQERRIQYV